MIPMVTADLDLPENPEAPCPIVFLTGIGWHLSFPLSSTQAATKVIAGLQALRLKKSEDPFPFLDEDNKPLGFVVPAQIVACLLQLTPETDLAKKQADMLDAQAAFYRRQTPPEE
jgi:hypothetical protein